MSAKSIGEYQAEIADLRRKLDTMARIYQGRERYEYVPEPERQVDSLISQINRILNPAPVPLPEGAQPEEAPQNFTEPYYIAHGVEPGFSGYS